VAKVRETFVDFFASKHGHTRFPSSPVVPYDDPTLLFANAGMNQFKPIFMGQADPAGPLGGLKRAANTQKCIRAGGKHNDLDDVGKDVYHHTFFEMLGSWSFGDYFKKEAIGMAWELLTEVYKIDPDRLYASYFGGDLDEGLEPDLEAKELWLQFLPPERVLPFDKKDNFWEMGDVGPCGPCTEIHVDRIGGRDAASLVNADDPDVLEIWNLVFIQFNREANSELKVLPNQHVDTGLGLERLVSVLQDKRSNYDTDVFEPLLTAIEQQLGIGPYQGRVGSEDIGLKDTAYRVVSDHLRTLSFAIADGALPSNEGRGYVLRRVLRRAVRYGQQILGAQPGFFAKLVPEVVKAFGDAFPELKAKEALIVSVLEDEERSFNTMLTRGIKYFNELPNIETTKLVSGSEAFFLYDSLGFPLDLTELMAEEKGWAVDSKGFSAAMKEQKDRSRSAQKTKSAGGAVSLGVEQTAFLATSLQVPPTNDSPKYEWDTVHGAALKAIFDPATQAFLEPSPSGGLKQALLDATSADTTDGTDSSSQKLFGVVLDSTSFYAEAGGQAADSGTLELFGGEVTVEVVDVQSFAGFVVHIGKVVAAHKPSSSTSTSSSSSTATACKVDYERRRKVAPNHTLTHVLNGALQAVLGPEVSQKGSQCDEKRLRFDFSHGKALTPTQVKEVELLTQQAVAAALPVDTKTVPLAQAQEIFGLKAVFGETYPDPVRVVAVQHALDAVLADPANEKWGESSGASIEFCGGTHLGNTKEAKAFVLTEETAVSKGVRRVVALTGDAAVEAMEKGNALEAKVRAAAPTFASASPAGQKKKKNDGAAGSAPSFPAKFDVGVAEASVLQLREELDELGPSIGLAVRSEARLAIDGFQKSVAAAKKELSAARAAAGLKALEADLKNAVEKSSELSGSAAAEGLVLAVDVGSDSKTLSKALNVARGLVPDRPVLLVTAERGSGKVLAAACVPKAVLESGGAGLSADAWVKAALEPVGGKGGGRAEDAQGQGKVDDEEQGVADVQAAAVAFLEATASALVK